MTTAVMDAIGTAIADSQRILILTHKNPDGDALGSLTAMGQVLRSRGKHVNMAVERGMLDKFLFLPQAERVRDNNRGDSADYDLLIALDCGDEKRIGELWDDLTYPKPPIVNIDHHVTNNQFGDHNLVPVEAASTCEVLYDLFTHLDYNVTQSVAISLLTGVVTDTLCFRTSNTTPHSLETASALIQAGAELQPIVTQALAVRSFANFKMWRAGLNNMRLEVGVAWTTVTRKEREQAGYDHNGSGGLSNMLCDIEEARAAAVLVELDSGRISVSMRSRPPYRVSDVAVELGGGGHAQAAGVTLDMPLEKAEFEVVRNLKASITAQHARLSR